MERAQIETLFSKRDAPSRKEIVMSARVGIVDYQMGNLRSVQKALQKNHVEAFISSSIRELNEATHLILPGVGAFRDAMRELSHRDLVPFLRDWAQSGKPFLGICLGMQLLFDSSDEGGKYDGLSILPGRVVRFEPDQIGEDLKIPHMGWNQVRSTISNDPMLIDLAESPYVYFVHSYYVVPSEPAVTWLEADYGRPFCAGVRKGNVMATQFHPEKSQRDGLQLLANLTKSA
jgi:imidazole glycerol-phosphate synthase subunit HisH